MKQIIIILLSLFIYIQDDAQESVKYIDTKEPVIETAAPSRDGSNVYHFYYSFNWSNDSTVYSNKLNPKIEEIEVYEFGAKDPFKTFYAPNNSQNQIELMIKKEDLDSYDQIQYAVKWEISNTVGQRISNVTNRRTLRIKFDSDIELKVAISDERIFYVDDINKPRIKIKTNQDGTSIENLTLRLQQNPNAPIVAEVKDEITRINSNIFSELVFETTGLVDLKENTSYYLYGKLKNSNLSITIPLPSESNNVYQLTKKEYFYIKPLFKEGKNIKVQGNSPVEKILDASGEVSEVKASLKLGSYGNREYSLSELDDQRWGLAIPGDTNIPFGTYNIEFTGVAKNGRPMKPTTFSYIKSPLKRVIIQMELKDNVYKATAEFSEPAVGNVYLVIDGIDVQMNKSLTDPTVYVIDFSFNDNTLKQLSEKIIKQSNNQKRVLITTKVNGVEDEAYLAKDAAVVDMRNLEGKKKNEIKEYLEKIGFKENIDKLAKNISEELKKDENERNWDSNVWTSLAEWAPKAIPLILMLI